MYKTERPHRDHSANPHFTDVETEVQRGHGQDTARDSLFTLSLCHFQKTKFLPGSLSRNRCGSPGHGDPAVAKQPPFVPGAGRYCYKSESACGPGRLGANHFPEPQFPHPRKKES